MFVWMMTSFWWTSSALLLLLFRLDFSAGAKTSKKQQAISEQLNALLKGYERNLRPDFGGPPLDIYTNILIRSMGPVSEEDMMFSMDCYFRQNWLDKRLKFNPVMNITELRLSGKILKMVWIPDTFFLNGQGSYLHTMTYDNKLFRISPDGSVLYSQRLTIKSKCPMRLEKYPLDTQTCPLMIGSYGYTNRDVLLRWKDVLPGNYALKKYTDIKMAQFTLIDTSHNNYTTGHNHGKRHVLGVSFRLQREIGYYLLQIYLPCYLIVIISWVSFWINREATPARVTLGITTLLTTCTIAITGREGIPKVSYSTALDIFLLMCFSFVFAALVEYAGVNYFTKTVKIEGPPEEEKDKELSMPLLHATYTGGTTGATSTSHATVTKVKDVNGHAMVSVMGKLPEKETCFSMFLQCLKGNSKYRHMKALGKTSPVSLSKIDSLARIIFPFSFTCLNILYWAGFLYYF